MKLKRLSALIVAASVLSGCNVGTLGLQGANSPQVAADKAAHERLSARAKLLSVPTVCPVCCVAVTGTSNVTVTSGQNTYGYNFEINTAANGAFGIGRVNFVDNKGTPAGNDDANAIQYTIVRTECILDRNGLLIGARVYVDLDESVETVLEDVVFTLVGAPPGGSDSHVKVNTLSAEFIGGFTGAPFVAFESVNVAQNSTQNVFPDDGKGDLNKACDGVPDPGIEPVPMTLD